MSPEPRDPRARLAASGLLDVDFYAALRGRKWDDAEEAVADFVDWAMPRGVPPRPDVDLAAAPRAVRSAWRGGRPKQLLDHLATPETTRLDPTATSAVLETARAIGTAASEPIDWAAAASQRERVPGRVSVVVSGTAGRRATLRAVDLVLEHAFGHDLEVLVVATGLRVGDVLSLAAALGPRGVQVVPSAEGVGVSAARNTGAVRSSGEHLALLDSSTQVRAGWLPPLLAALQDLDTAGVQPLVVDDAETIHSAGLVFVEPGLLPAPLLRGHQRDDARPLADEQLRALDGSLVVLRSVDFLDQHGLDETFDSALAVADLCLRLAERGDRTFRVVPEVVVTRTAEDEWPPEDREWFAARFAGSLTAADRGVYRRTGLFLARVDQDAGPGAPVAHPMIERVPDRPADHLRWSLKLPSTRGHWGDRWGDTHFADALARALRRLDQQVVTCRHGAHDAGPTHLDDVSLGIRGQFPVDPVPGKTNVLWVISHPDEVDPAELEGHDLVFAASAAWSRRMSDETGRVVEPLLQASEFGPAEPVVLPDPGDRALVFVGSTHEGRHRRLVEDAVASGVALSVYGAGWDGLVPAYLWKGEYVPNDELPGLYRRHGIVLADHWPDMARHGFVANRVFDALAVGARVICDDVAGISDLFPSDAVAVCRSPHEIRTTVEGWERFGVDVAGGLDLSFSGRAETLLARVLATRSGDRLPGAKG